MVSGTFTCMLIDIHAWQTQSAHCCWQLHMLKWSFCPDTGMKVLQPKPGLKMRFVYAVL